jgi:hypothetical protein
LNKETDAQRNIRQAREELMQAASRKNKALVARAAAKLYQLTFLFLGNDPSYEQNNSKMSKRRMRAHAFAAATTAAEGQARVQDCRQIQ